MERRILGYITILVGIILIGYAGFSFINGSGNKENLLQVITSLLAGTIALFGGIHVAMTQNGIVHKRKNQHSIRPNLSKIENKP